jgi:predicted nucleic acid-binding protein
MKRLLDVNVLLAAIWATHQDNAKTLAWLEKKSIALCPIAELGFLRISTNPKSTFAPRWTKLATCWKLLNAKEMPNGSLMISRRWTRVQRRLIS